MYVELDENADMKEIIRRLSKVYGIKSISPVIKTDKTEEAINESAVQLAQSLRKTPRLKSMLNVLINHFHSIRILYSVKLGQDIESN